MKKENWEFLKFCLRIAVKYAPRLMVAPYVGAARAIWVVVKTYDAEITVFLEAEEKARQDVSSKQVVG
jgi:hypothetical protein